MAKTPSVVNLDPIDRQKRKSWLSRLLITRWHGGLKIKKEIPYGHYMFTGEQGSGKTASALWYAEKLAKKYKKMYKIELYSNIEVGHEIDKKRIPETIADFDPNDKVIRIVIIDEIHTYFPKDNQDKETKEIQRKLITIFSQLRKRKTFILSTSQIYGRLDKSLREQCLYMITNKNTWNSKIKNEFIAQEDIIADDLGRWAGEPRAIHIHGLARTKYNTKKIIWN